MMAIELPEDTPLCTMCDTEVDDDRFCRSCQEYAAETYVIESATYVDEDEWWRNAEADRNYYRVLVL